MTGRGDAAFNAAAYRHYRHHAEQVERAGDAIGGNDTELSNRLWRDAEAIRAYAERAYGT